MVTISTNYDASPAYHQQQFDASDGLSKKKIPIKKYSQNGLGRLHESVIIDTTSKFVYLDKDQKPHFVNEIERANDILIPGDTIDTQNPIPFIFESENDFQQYLEEAKKLLRKDRPVTAPPKTKRVGTVKEFARLLDNAFDY
jgi:hypothetical protein